MNSILPVERMIVKALGALLALCAFSPGWAQEVPKKHFSGVEIEAGAGEDWKSGGVSIGGEHWVTDYFVGRGGLGLYGAKENGLFGGVYLGGRLTLPGRVAPFVGAGSFLGWWSYEDYDGTPDADHNGDGRIDHADTNYDVIKFVTAVYPEAGVRIQVGSTSHVNLSVRYMVTSDGRRSDRYMYFVGFCPGEW
ncbi:MAG: hypothetical protein QM760_15280 [Nibricoccus sp.]